MLAHCLRRWSTIEPTLLRRIVFAGISAIFQLGFELFDYHNFLYQCHADLILGHRLRHS